MAAEKPPPDAPPPDKAGSDGHIIGRLARVAARLEDALLVLLLGGLLALAGTQILLRNLFDAGLAWGDPLLRVMVLWLGLLGAMAATRDGNHITIDILSRWLPRRARVGARRATDGFGAAVCAVLAYHGARFVLMEHGAGGTAFAGVPAWACELVIPVGFGIMALRLLLSAVGRPPGVMGGDRPG